MNSTTTLDHEVVSKSDWLRASSELLRKEKELTRMSDDLASPASRTSLDPGRERIHLPRLPWQSKACGSISLDGASSRPITSCSVRIGPKGARAARSWPITWMERSNISPRGTSHLCSSHVGRWKSSQRSRGGWVGTFLEFSSGGSDFNQDSWRHIHQGRSASGAKEYNHGTAGPYSEENPGNELFLQRRRPRWMAG